MDQLRDGLTMGNQKPNDSNSHAPKTWKMIGAGSSGVVLASPCRNQFVVKIARKPEKPLWNEYRIHRLIEISAQKFPNLDVKIPRLINYVSRDAKQPAVAHGPCCVHYHDDKKWHSGFMSVAGQYCNTSADMIMSERILPLVQHTRLALFRRFVPVRYGKHVLLDLATDDCTVRPYLGDERQTEFKMSASWNMRNLPISFPDLEALEVDTEELAAVMGNTLAMIHWDTKCDGRGISFVLASKLGPNIGHFPAGMWRALLKDDWRTSEDNHSRQTQLWCFGFDEVRPLNLNEAGVNMMAEAFHASDPYYPRPNPRTRAMKPVWDIFVRAYKRMADRILDGASFEIRGLPDLFLKKVAALEHERVMSIHSNTSCPFAKLMFPSWVENIKANGQNLLETIGEGDESEDSAATEWEDADTPNQEDGSEVEECETAVEEAEEMGVRKGERKRGGRRNRTGHVDVELSCDSFNS